MLWIAKIEPAQPAPKYLDPRLIPSVRYAIHLINTGSQGWAQPDAVVNACRQAIARFNCFLKKSDDHSHPNAFAVHAKGKEPELMFHIMLERHGPPAVLSSGDAPKVVDVCPSCARPNQGASYHAAHNVIPASRWFEIVPTALLAVLGTLAQSPSDHAAAKELRPRIERWRDTHTRGGTKDRGRQFGATFDNYLSELVGCGTDAGRMGSTGKTPIEGAQCGACEQLQADRSLIQRVGALPESRPFEDDEVRDVGVQFMDRLTSISGTMDHSAEVITQATALLVASDMKSRATRCGISNDPAAEWLKARLLQHWDAFQQALVRAAIRACRNQS